MKKLFFRFGFVLSLIFICYTATTATTFYQPQMIRIFSSTRTCRADSICVNINNIFLHNDQFSFDRKLLNSNDMRTIRDYRNYLENKLKKSLDCSSMKGKYNLTVGFFPPLGTTILESSGDTQIDNWAINSIKEAGPYKYLEYYDSRVRYEIKLQYYCK